MSKVNISTQAKSHKPYIVRTAYVNNNDTRCGLCDVPCAHIFFRPHSDTFTCLRTLCASSHPNFVPLLFMPSLYSLFLVHIIFTSRKPFIITLVSGAEGYCSCCVCVCVCVHLSLFSLLVAVMIVKCRQSIYTSCSNNMEKRSQNGRLFSTTWVCVT